MTSCLRRLAPVAMAFALLSPSASAIVPHVPEGLAPDAATRLSGVPFVLPVVDVQESKAWAASDPAFRAFVREAGVEWQARWDRRTARLSAASGSFPAWLPADARARTPDEIVATLSELDAHCRALVARHPDLLRLPVPADALRLDPLRSVPVDEGRVWQVSYQVIVGGVPVEGAAVFFRLNSGRLVQFGQEGVSDALAGVPTRAAVTPETARELGLRESAALLEPSLKPVARAVAEPRLALLPWSDSPRSFTGQPGTGLQYRLAWRTAQRIDGRMETWAAWHDALTGARLALWDDNKYACPTPAVPQGRVVGGVYLGAIEEVSESLRGMPYAAVDNGGPVVADVNGVFPYTAGQPASTSLSGRYFDMFCVTCNTPAQAAATSAAWGYLTLGMGGNDIVGNGLSTKAERNCYYHLNVVRDIASKHLDDASAGGFFTRTTPANVNFQATCNAFWDGSGVNFFRAGGGCNNTGEIADVMQHEWGHGLDQFTGGGTDGARGEGLGDTVAFFSTHDPRLGPYFVQGDGGGIRNADENVIGVMDTTNLGAFCPPDGSGFGGPLGYEVHCEGQLFASAWWHLARNMRQKMVAAGGSDAAGWYLAEKLFFQSLPTSRTYVPTGAQPTYDAVMVVDDDNGNLADGTPNATEINEAFGHHGMTPGTVVGDSADCIAPPAPAITLSAAQQPLNGLWQVHVQWTATPGAAEYRIVRNQSGGAGADEPVATVTAPATDFLDDDVTDGVTYFYRVTAFLPNGCTSIAENRQQVDVGALTNIVLDDWSFDDSGPDANFNGVAEPGETLTIDLTALNAGTAGATAVLAELLSAAPGVTVTRGSQSLGDIASGATAATAAPHFEITIDPSVPCGSTVALTTSFTATEGCSSSGFVLAIGAPPAPCEPPDARPRLRFEAFSISDALAGGGTGDASGSAEPGETVRVPIDLANFGNADATSIAGTLTLLAGPGGVSVTDPDTPWSTIRPTQVMTSGGAPAHVEVDVPSSVACGSTIDFRLSVSYDGPSGTYADDFVFTMLVGRIVETWVLDDDFEGGDNGFTHGADCTRPGCDDFQHDVPTTASTDDPAVAHSGTKVWGNDLGSLGGNQSNGQYRQNTTSWLSTPVLDCTSLTGTTLSFWRWLSVEGCAPPDPPCDWAMVGVCLDDPATAAIPLDASAAAEAPMDRTWGGECQNFQRVWLSPGDTATLADTAWTYQEFDISAIADGEPFVRVVFGLTADGGLQLGGWTIDDLRIGKSEVVCGNCSSASAPASPGASVMATGVKSETSVEFEWATAPALQSGEEWRVYRGTRPDAVTNLLTPAAFTTPAFLDDAAPNALYYYNIVTANCLGLETP